MSYNFWFKLVIKKENKDKLINYINDNGSMNDIGYIGRFEFDKYILDYLKSYHSDEEIQKQIKIHKKASIGYIFYNEHVEEDNPDTIGISFMAATRYMSELFRESESIYKWFIELSNVTSSLLAYIDFEHLGYRIIFHKGKEVNVQISYNEKEYSCSGVEQFCDIIDNFHKLANIYFNGQ
ncbi:MAG: hypothetical protein Q8900_03395 [Bacillota bacterium]|nr:hypothetical protein [Bacillota bacterium]